MRQTAVHRAVECGAVLGNVNALREHRCAPTARAARPSGVDVACAQLTDRICAMAGAATTHALTAVPPRRIEVVTFVPTRHPFTSPDVKRCGSTLQGLDPPATRFTTRAASHAIVCVHDLLQHRSHTRCGRPAEHIFRSLMSAESLITRRDRLQRVA